MAVAFTVVPLNGYLPGHDPRALVGFFPAALGLLMIFGLGRAAWIKAGASSIRYMPALGSAKEFPRSDLKSIIRVPSSRGLSSLEFRDKDNRRIVSCPESYARSDVEALSQFLGVKLTWDPSNLAAKRTDGGEPSWDEFKSQLDPEELAEFEKHMKSPGIDQ